MDSLHLDINKRYTYADYLLWFDDKRRELLDGFIHMMTPAPARKHQDISGKLFYLFYDKLLKTKSDCKVYAAPFDVRLPMTEGKLEEKDIYTVVQPDITVVCDLAKLDDKGCIGAPDLIVEIVSPSTLKKDIKDKFILYEKAGVKEYWIINPNDENVSVFVLDSSGKYEFKGIYAEDMVVKVSIFDDFKICLKDLF